MEIRDLIGAPGSELDSFREQGGLYSSPVTLRPEGLEHFGVLGSALCRRAQCHTSRRYLFAFPKEHRCTPISYAPSPTPDMRISSMGVQSERSQGVDAITMHLGSLVHDVGWAYCSFG